MLRPSFVVALLAALVLVGFPIWGIVRFKAIYDDAMFVPRPCDRATMVKALDERFGPKVTLLDLPVVNRDINGYAAVVRTAVPPGRYASEGHTFSFERIGGRDVCLMTILPWELKPLRATFLARSR